MLVSLLVDVSVADPALLAVIDNIPGVPPVVALLYKITLEAVMALEVIVTAPGVPDMTPVVPTESLAAVVAWITNLFPADPKTRFPFVAVIAPSVAVSVVAAVTDPALAVIFPADVTSPVPAVTVPPNVGDAEKKGSAPVDPIRTVPVAPTATLFMGEAPAPRSTLWFVSVLDPMPPLPTPRVPVRVIVCPDADVVRPVVPPVMVMLLLAGLAVPASEEIVATSPDARTKVPQLPAPWLM